MTIEEKLQHFMDATTQKVNAENASQIEEYEKGLEKVLAEHKQDAVRKARLSVQLKEESLTKQKNAEVAKEQMEIREQTGKLQRELQGKLYTEVKGKLERYMATGAYEKYLIEQVKEAKRFAGRDQVTIYIDPADMAKQAAISMVANTPVMVSAYEFGGGIRAVIARQGILIDQSFDTKLREAFNGFVFHLDAPSAARADAAGKN